MAGDTRPLPLVEAIGDVLHTQFGARIEYRPKVECAERDRTKVVVDNEVDHFRIFVYGAEGMSQVFCAYHIPEGHLRATLEFFQKDSAEKGYEYRGPQGLEAHYFLGDDFTQQQ